MARNRLLAENSTAPEFRLPRLGGGEVTLKEIAANGPALLAFFKISCPVCQFTFPFLERIHRGGHVPVYGISQDSAADTRNYNRQLGVTFPTLLDLEETGFPVSNAFGISHVPTIFVVEPDGRISRVIEGFGKQDLEAVAAPGGVAVFQPGEYVPEWKAG